MINRLGTIAIAGSGAKISSAMCMKIWNVGAGRGDVPLTRLHRYRHALHWKYVHVVSAGPARQCRDGRDQPAALTARTRRQTTVIVRRSRAANSQLPHGGDCGSSFLDIRVATQLLRRTDFHEALQDFPAVLEPPETSSISPR
jgi:hypothetical protein